MSGRPWLSWEDALLRECFSDQRTDALAAVLRRTESSVHQRAKHFGLFKSKAFFTSDEAGYVARFQSHPKVKAAQFKAGHATWNKGKEHRPGGRSAETHFRRGNKPQTWQPIGTERIDKDGNLVRKVSDTGARHGDWLPVHRVVWESANGPVPDGCLVIFKPGRKTADAARITADACECVTRAELMRRNSYLRYGPEIADVIRLRGAIARQINKRAKHEQEHQ